MCVCVCVCACVRACVCVCVGLLWREQEAAVMYGSIDGGKNIAADSAFSDLVRTDRACNTPVQVLSSL